MFQCFIPHVHKHVTDTENKLTCSLCPVCLRYVNTLLKLVPQVLALQDQLREAVQSGDMETCHGICRIAVTLGENHSRFVCVCVIIEAMLLTP